MSKTQFANNHPHLVQMVAQQDDMVPLAAQGRRSPDIRVQQQQASGSATPTNSKPRGKKE